MPQSVDAIAESPHPTPQFVLASIPTYLLTPVLTLYRQGSADASATPPCHCSLPLSIPFVEEQDPTISLQMRWFVDYDPLVPATTRPWDTEDLPGDFNNSGTLRQSVKTFQFDADRFGIGVNGQHTVDVVVAETTAYVSPTTGKEVGSAYNRSEYRFFIDVNVSPGAPTGSGLCPASLPSVRVCQ